MPHRVHPREWLLALVLCAPILLDNPRGFLGYQASFLASAPVSILIAIALLRGTARYESVPTSLMWAAGGLFGVMSLSAFTSDSPVTSLFGSAGRSSGLVSLLLVMSLGWVGGIVGQQPLGLVAVRRAMTLVGAAMAMGSLFQKIGILLPGYDKLGPSGRILGTMGSASQIGAIELVLGVCAISMTLDDRENSTWRRIGIVCGAPMFCVVVMSGSRAAWLGAIVAVSFVMAHPQTRRLLDHRRVIVLIASGVMLVSLSLVVPSTRVRITRLFPSNGGIPEGRIDIWRAAVPAWLERPFQGFGLDQARAPIMRHLAFNFETMYGSADTVDRAHSLILDQLLWGGLIGLIVLVILVVVWARNLRIRSMPPHLVVLLSAIVGYSTHLLVNFPVPESDRVVWIISGLLVGAMAQPTGRSSRIAKRVPLLLCVVITPLTFVGGMNLLADQRLRTAVAREAVQGPVVAVALYKDALSTADFLPLYRETYARALARAGENSNLISAAQNARRSNPADPVLTELELRARTQVAYVSGDIQAGKELVNRYRQLCDEYPSRVPFQIGLALAQLTAGDPDSARRTATIASSRAPRDPTPEIILSLIEKSVGNADTAQVHSREAERRQRG